MRRLAVVVLVALSGLAYFAVPAGAATRGRHITDPKYFVSFYLPASWKHSVITTSTAGTTKLLVQDVSGSTVVGLVQVQVINGHNTNASAIASGILTSPGAKILGSSVAKFPFGKAEQLRFSLQETNAVVLGVADAFYEHGHTYVVAFDSVKSSVNATSRAAVMSSWVG